MLVVWETLFAWFFLTCHHYACSLRKTLPLILFTLPPLMRVVGEILFPQYFLACHRYAYSLRNFVPLILSSLSLICLQFEKTSSFNTFYFVSLDACNCKSFLPLTISRIWRSKIWRSKTWRSYLYRSFLLLIRSNK